MSLDRMPHSVRALVGQDVGSAQAVTKALMILRDAQTDPRRREAVEDVLTGRTTLRQLFRSEAGRSMLDAGAATLLHDAHERSPQEWQELAEEGRMLRRGWAAEFERLSPDAQRQVAPES